MTTAEPAFSSSTGGVDLSLIVVAQFECTETHDAAVSTSFKIKFFPFGRKNLMCDVSLASPRPLVPVSCRKGVFTSIHSIEHPDIRATKWLISSRFVWRNMGADITGFWVSRFGVPAVLTSDKGTQFSSTVWGNLCSTLGISHRLTTAYHPKANGLVERFHRQLKYALRSRMDSQDWPLHLPWVLLGLRAALKDASAISSAEMVYSEPLTLPGDFVDSSTLPPDSFMQQLRDKMFRFQPPPMRQVPDRQASQEEATLHKADPVYIKWGAVASSISPLYSDPYQVISRE
jgi:hypothetical protein